MTVFDRENKLVENSTAEKQIFEFRPLQIEMVRLTKYDRFNQKVPEIKKGYQYRCVSFLETDFWQRVEQVIKAAGSIVLDLSINTWTLKDEQAVALMKMYDEKRILNMQMLTGINFKSKGSDRYARVLSQFDARKKRLRSFENHAKVTIFKTDTNFITIEGSANLWGHIAVEQFTVTESEQLYYHHLKWINKMMNK